MTRAAVAFWIGLLCLSTAIVGVALLLLTALRFLWRGVRLAWSRARADWRTRRRLRGMAE